MPLEIERKFLIRMPDLKGWENYPSYEIVQTYLLSEEGVTRRVRARTTADGTEYFYTEKHRKSARTAVEDERSIAQAEYDALLKETDHTRTPIEKRRYAIPYDGHTIEIDIYSFWKKQATLEVELQREDEAFALPPFIEVIREVTADYRYKNHALAREIPLEDQNGAVFN